MSKIVSRTPLVALLTDFGLSDNYVGVMKGIIQSKLPQAKIIDITHNVPAQNVRWGAFQLLTSYKSFGRGTLFICVVDPGVGSRRKIIYAETDQYKFIAPDNGLLSWVFDEQTPRRAWDISQNELKNKASQTFHGRDIMAPIAAKVLMGEDPHTLGVPMKDWQKLPFPAVQKHGSLWEGSVVAIDGFGNIITNVKTEELKELTSHSKLWVDWGRTGESIRGLSESYSSVQEGKALVLGGSAGFIEISVRNGNAAKKTSLKLDDKIKFHFRT